MIVRLSVAPAVGVEVAAARTRWVAPPPDVTVTFVTVLVAVQPRQWAVTVYAYVPAVRPESVQLVTAVGATAVGQEPPALPAPRWTEYVTGPAAGGVTADHVRETVPGPGVAPVIAVVLSVPTLATALPAPTADQ